MRAVPLCVCGCWCVQALSSTAIVCLLCSDGRAVYCCFDKILVSHPGVCEFSPGGPGPRGSVASSGCYCHVGAVPVLQIADLSQAEVLPQNCREQTTARRWLQSLRMAGQQRNKGERTHFPPLAALLDGQIFLWYCVSCAKGETHLCMHDLQRPSDFICVVGPFVIVGCVGASTFFVYVLLRGCACVSGASRWDFPLALPAFQVARYGLPGGTVLSVLSSRPCGIVCAVWYCLRGGVVLSSSWHSIVFWKSRGNSWRGLAHQPFCFRGKASCLLLKTGRCFALVLVYTTHLLFEKKGYRIFSKHRLVCLLSQHNS